MAATSVVEQFELLQMLQHGTDVSFGRARRVEDGRIVLLEIPREAGLRTIERQRHEIEIGRVLDPGAALHPVGLGTFAHGPVVVFDDFSGTPLAELVNEPMEIGFALQIATALVASLDIVHRSGIVHRNINPQNLLFDRETCVAKLSGFGIASTVRGEHWALREQMEASLPYMSPEQTGRIDRPVDTRSDLYSVGVILYEMLMGSRPFEARDVIGWIYCHVARLPMPPAAITARVPQPLSDMVMKLVAKLPEERYQTSAGLLVDLRRCLGEWTTNRAVSAFALGTEDVSDQLQIPRKLYGRRSESEQLARLLQRVSTLGNPGLAVITGPAGIGKSALARSLEEAVVRSGGMFATGTFEGDEQPFPYSALAHAFHEIVSNLLSEGADGLAAWRRRLLDALGPLGQLVVDVVPSLETVIGKQSAVPPLPLAEAQRRFFLVIRRFVSALTSNGHVMVMFVDDLDRADAASLALIEYLVCHPQTGKLLVIGTYRDNLPDDHPLHSCLRQSRARNADLAKIVLAPLGLADVSEQCADALGTGTTHVASLASLVWERTGGNPLSVIQLLEELTREEALVFDAASRRWHWDLSRACDVMLGDNLVERRLARLQTLDPAVREVLELAACLERELDVRTLTMLVESAPTILPHAVEVGLLCAVGASYRFVHDRIREAIYAGIPDATRTIHHVRIGRTMLAQLAPVERSDRIFEVAGQFNRGLPLVSEPAERRRVAELELQAGQLAAAASSFGAAASYVTAGIELLAPWTTDDPLAFALHLELARCELARGHFSAADALLAPLRDHARNGPEHRLVERLEIDTALARGALSDALTVAVASLARIGIQVSRHPSSDELSAAMRDAMDALGDRSIEDLEGLVIVDDPVIESALDLLAAVLPVAYFSDPDLHTVIACRCAALTIRHGVTGASTLALASLALELDWRFHQVDVARRFAKVARTLCETHAYIAYSGRTFIALGVVAAHTGSLGEALELQRAARAAALDVGDLAYAGFAGGEIVTLRVARGDPLDDVVHELNELARETTGHMTSIMLTVERAFIANMQGRTVTSRTFTCRDFDENQFLATVEVAPIVTAWFHVRKLQALCIHGDAALALEQAELARPMLWALTGQVRMADYHYYAALAHAMMANSAASDERASHVLAVAEHEQALREWAEPSTGGFGHMHALVAAEHARVTDRTREAIQLFEQAKHMAHDNSLGVGEAIAQERASVFYGELGLTTAAAHCASEARRCFAQWDAHAKVAALDKSGRPLARAPIRDEPLRSAALEIVQLLSSEMLRPTLLGTFLHVLQEQSGARKAVFLSVAGEHWTVETAAGVDAAVPSSIVNHVLHSHENVVLHDATMPGPYSVDNYVVQYRPRALLCMPVARHGAVIGIVYLENDLVPGLFSNDRVSILEVLVEQAAISLENARLYAERGRQIAERQQAEATLRSILDNMVDGVYVIDREARLTFANRAGVQLVGIGTKRERANALDLANDLQLANRDGTPMKPNEVPILRALAGEIVSSVEVVARDLDRGRATYLRVSAAPIQDEKGAIAGAVAVAINVTRETELERLKEQFLQVVAHELKTPITIVKGYADLLRTMRADVDAQQQPLLDALVAGADRVDRLVSDLLVSWQLQRGVLELTIERDVDLVEVVEQLISRLETLTSHRVTLESARPVIASVDRELFSKVVSNLLDNAVRYSPPGDPVAVRMGLDGDHAYVSVTDRGIGIPAEKRAHVFEPFFRAHADTPYDTGGIGLGLYIARAIVVLHEGAIDVQTEEGKGSTFRFTVPTRS
jgi:PAS domain S-box-containing protein